MSKRSDLVQEFKEYLVSAYNEDVYYQLKSFLNECDISDNEYDDTLDYIVDNLHGSIQWNDDGVWG